MNQADIGTLSRAIKNNETKAVMKIFPLKKTPGPDDIITEF